MGVQYCLMVISCYFCSVPMCAKKGAPAQSAGHSGVGLDFRGEGGRSGGAASSGGWCCESTLS